MTQAQRRPSREDIPAVLEQVAGGASLRKACSTLGLHTPSTHTFIDEDDDLREQYARAREQRADKLAEDALSVGMAAALGQQHEGRKVDPAGARVLLDTIKWITARMAPKTAPVSRHSHEFGSLSDADLDARIAAKEAAMAAGVNGEPEA